MLGRDSGIEALEPFVQGLADVDSREVPLLVVRLPALERTAWREGLRKARSLERRASRVFAAAAARVLRAGDPIAHDAGSDVFLAALAAPVRDDGRPRLHVDARSALARIALSMERVARLDVETGWTTLSTGPDGVTIGDAVERALVRGAQERERYAFFSALGHELRTPLASIRGYLETVLDDDVEPAARKRFLTIAHSESLRLARLVDGMFEISLLDLHATRAASVGRLDVALDAACDACAVAAASRFVRVQRWPCGPVPIAMDSDRLTLVLINIVENAIKHGRRGGTVALAVDLGDPRVARIAIVDDGPGVPPNERERIFALGERGPTEASGTGLGLALVRLMLERAGGGVTVDTSPFGGACFTVTVPRASAGCASQMRSL